MWLAALALAGQDAPLQWKLKKDQTFTVVMKNRSATRVLWDGKEGFKEERVDEASFRATVASIDGDGTAVLRLVPTAYFFDVDRGAFRITVRSKRLDTGAPDLTVHVQAEKLSQAHKQVADDIFRTAFKDLYKKLSIEITVDRHGTVLLAKADGDYFEDIEEPSVVSQVMLATARDLLDRQDLATTLGGQAFVTLPREAASGETWPVERVLSLAGIDCRGKGKAAVQSASDGFTQIQEKTTFALDASRFGASLKKFAELVNPELQVSSSMETERSWAAEATWWFNQAAARAETFNCKGKIQIEGEIKGTLKGQDVKSRLALERDVTLNLRWE